MNLRRKCREEVNENSLVYLNEGGSFGGGYLRSCPDYSYLPSGGANGIAKVGDDFLKSMKNGSSAGSYWSAKSINNAYQKRPSNLVIMVFSWFFGAFFVK